MRLLLIFYGLLLVVLTSYSYGFVDPNITLTTHPLYRRFHEPLFELVFNNRPLSTTIFTLIILLFSIFYFLFFWLVKRKRLVKRQLFWLIGLTTGVLFFSYPAFSHDIFNYIFTAKVTYFYRENPYLVMPIEFIGDPNLAFTRAANKVALYGPSWIALTLVPYIFGFNNIVATIFSFKLFILIFYLATVWLIWKISGNIHSVVLFALNPLVIIETLVSAHNDIIMIFFALLAFYLFKKRKIMYASLFLLISVLIKYATLFLLPVFLYAAYRTMKGNKINWEKVYIGAAISMLLVFAISPLREEIYPWYVIWILSFAVLVPKQKILLSLVITLSLATLLRYIPVLYTGNYFGITPFVKELVTFVPAGLLLLFWLWQKFPWVKLRP